MKRKVRVFPKVSEEERDQVWFTQHDFKTFRKECWQLLKNISSSVPIPIQTEDAEQEQSLCGCSTITTTTRGLEDWSKTKYKQRKKRMKDSIFSVLLEQECIKNEGIDGRTRTTTGSNHNEYEYAEQRIAIEYKKLVQEAKRIALERGREDARYLQQAADENKSGSSISTCHQKENRNPSCSSSSSSPSLPSSALDDASVHTMTSTDMDISSHNIHPMVVDRSHRKATKRQRRRRNASPFVGTNHNHYMETMGRMKER